LAFSAEEAVGFLAERSPRSDLDSMGMRILRQNVLTAMAYRDSVPWGWSVPDSVFLRYVLPARVSQEPLVSWRPLMAPEVLEVVRGCATMEQAVLAVNTWCDSLLDYEPTQRRDQSPLVTRSSGIGRCEELAIYLIDALRSVCLPCRQAYTPWWTVRDNNHAWTEVWTPGGWEYVESASTSDSLSITWFSDQAERTGLVLAIAPDSVPGALAQVGSASILNVTSSYATTGALILSDDTTEVVVSVYNYGALRSMLTMDRDLRGVELGEGRYLLTWGWPVQGKVVEVTAGDTTRFLPHESALPACMLLNEGLAQ
jgi:hypothetical protein